MLWFWKVVLFNGNPSSMARFFKYLRDPTWTKVTNVTRISCAICQLIGFLQWRAIVFPSWPGYWQLLSGCQYMSKLCLWAGQTTIFSTSSCERLNFPALAKMTSYSVTFVREKLQLLRWFFTSTTHLLSRKKFVFTAQGTTSNICYPGKGTLRRCTCHFGSLPVA